MNQYIQKLNAELSTFSYSKGSVLDSLWEYYSQENPIRNHHIKQLEQKLAPAFEVLSFEESTDAFTLLYDLVAAYQHAAFIEGICIGNRLQEELTGA